MKQNYRQASIILFLTMFIVMVGFGVIMPILPFYAESMGATATDLGLLFAAYSVVQFLFAPTWGQLSDRIGRKPVLLIGLVGFGVSFVLSDTGVGVRVGAGSTGAAFKATGGSRRGLVGSDF